MKADINMNMDSQNVQEKLGDSAKQAGALSRKAVLTYLGLMGIAYDGAKEVVDAGARLLERAEKRGEAVEATLSQQAKQVQEQVQTDLRTFRSDLKSSFDRVTQTVARRGKEVEKEVERAAAEINRGGRKGESAEVKSIRIEVEGADNPPFDGYEELTVQDVADRLDGLSLEDLSRLRLYEEAHKNRVTILREVDERIENLTAAPVGA